MAPACLPGRVVSSVDPTKPDTSTHAHKPLAVWRRAFLAVLADCANVSKAARAAEVNRQYCYECRANDPSFAEEWDNALEEATDKLEERAWTRANFADVQYKFTKTGEPILHPITGEPYYEHVGSDTVLITLLKAHRPDKYKDRKEVTGKDGAPLVPPATDLTKLSREDKLALLAIRRKLQPKEGDSE
ncbi:hypothetical protein SAMN06269173_11171 [Hymenobacter mucosus]|uniref:Terminase small subunit n=1 Tax=Hymenobacter mucosus TaxID=1411120 RepID=A0A239AAI7_9BACT|nr:hypothetical protein SAMN06269173_11171 [Hymenobacter mucosus]